MATSDHYSIMVIANNLQLTQTERVVKPENLFRNISYTEI